MLLPLPQALDGPLKCTTAMSFLLLGIG